MDLADLADLAEMTDDVAVAALHRAKSSESLWWALPRRTGHSAPSPVLLQRQRSLCRPSRRWPHTHDVRRLSSNLGPSYTCALPTPVPFLPTPRSSKVATRSRAVMTQVTHISRDNSSRCCSRASFSCTTHRHSPPRQPPR